MDIIEERAKFIKNWKTGTKFASYQSYQMFVMIVASGVIFPSMHLLVFEPSLIYLVVFLIPWILISLFIAKKKRDWSLKISDKKIFEQPPNPILAPIKSNIEEFNEKIRIDKKIEILVEKENYKVCAIALSIGHKDYMLLSTGFLQFYKIHTTLAKPVLAHEYCHLYSQDSRNFLGFTIVNNYLKYWFVVSGILLIIVLLSLPKHKILPLFNSALCFFSASIIMNCFTPLMREKIEIVADLGAMYLTNSDDLIGALEHLNAPQWRLQKAKKNSQKHTYLTKEYNCRSTQIFIEKTMSRGYPKSRK